MRARLVNGSVVSIATDGEVDVASLRRLMEDIEAPEARTVVEHYIARVGASARVQTLEAGSPVASVVQRLHDALRRRRA